MQTLTSSDSSVGGRYSFATQSIQINLPQDILWRLQGANDFTDLEDTLLYTRIAHESTHLEQNLTTTFGLWKTLHVRMAGRLFYDGISGLIQENAEIKCPINDSIERGRTYHGSIGLLIAATEYVRSVALMEGGMRLPDEIKLPLANRPKTTTHPHVYYGGSPITFNAGLIMEFQALRTEAAALQVLRSIPEQHVNDILPLLRNSVAYRLPMNMMASAVGGSESAQIRDDASLRKLDSLTNAAISLALCPTFPGDPLFSLAALPNPLQDATAAVGPVPWEHLHPGWRFLEVAKVVRGLGLELSGVQNPGAVIAYVAGRLGWPPPEQAVQDFLSYAESKIMNAALLRDLIKIRSSIKELCEMEDTHPYARQHRLLSDKALRSVSHGPLSLSRTLRPLDFVLGEFCSEMFYQDRQFCSDCLSYVHHPECRLLPFLASARIVS